MSGAEVNLMAPITVNVRDKVRKMCAIESNLYSRLLPHFTGIETVELESFLQEAIPAKDKLTMSIIIVTDNFLLRHLKSIHSFIENNPEFEMKIIIMAHDMRNKEGYKPIPLENIHIVIPEGVSPEMIVEVANNSFEMLSLRYEKLKLQSRLVLSYEDIQSLTRVGQAMATEHNLDALIGLILHQARLLAGADSGSIYVVERNTSGKKPTHLRFKQSALTLQADEFLLSIDKNSIAGYCAVTGEPMLIDDVYALTGKEDYHFNTEFDKTHNYYTKSMMLIPMKNHRDEVIGVIQLINRKRDFDIKLSLEELKSEEVSPFEQADMEIISALAGQAAVAIQNNLLLQDIHNLFEGFVKASVTAIEQRDPTTSGHSFRVAEFAVGLAKKVDRTSSGRFESIRFSMEQIRELRYAALLHDFGKVGVREKVLVKAKKLYEDESELIKWRFMYIKKTVEKIFLNKKIHYLKEHGKQGFESIEKVFDEELIIRLQEIEGMLETILKANEPTVGEEGNFEKLEKISRNRVELDDGEMLPFLKGNELVSLSIRRGTLDQKERLEIESHVKHTYQFLIQIPWTGNLNRIPDIAHGHHEKLDGSGYPLGLKNSELSVQTRIMTISDIYDALTAADRPYKKSIQPEVALEILDKEAQDGHVDKNLLEIFIKADIFRLINRREGVI